MEHKCKIFKKGNKQSGITLVALVVTIVVLLILAGVSIRLVLDNNGIISRAGDAKDKHEQGRVNDQTDLDTAEDEIDKALGTYDPLKKIPEKTIEEAKADSMLESNEESKVKFTDGTVIIPKGYKISDATAEDVGHGVVIEDASQNQWVWVPVDDAMLAKMCNTSNTIEYKMCGTTDDDPVKAKWYSSSAILSGKTITRTTPGTTSDYREPDLVVGSKGTSYDAENYKTIVGNNGTLKEMAQLFKDEYETMIKSIEKYKGFYIGRYELSGSVDNPTEQSGATIDSVNWYNLYNACKKLGANADGSDKEGIATRMIWGCQWDATCDFIATKGETKSITDSRDWGNYSDSINNAAVKKTKADGTEENKFGRGQITGYSEYWKANNIYDFAGNYWEWTQEAISTLYRTPRGGNYGSNGSNRPASSRSVLSTTLGDGIRFPSHFNNYNWHLECENQWKKI